MKVVGADVPVRVDCRIMHDEPGMPDCIQTRIKLTESRQDLARFANLKLMYGDVPDDFIILEEIRILADELEKKLFPKLRWLRQKRDGTMKEEDIFYCPICGFENPEKIYTAPGQGAVGCNECLSSFEPWDYYERR